MFGVINLPHRDGGSHKVKQGGVQEVVVDDARGQIVEAGRQSRGFSHKLTNLDIDLGNPAGKLADLETDGIPLGGQCFDLQP